VAADLQRIVRRLARSRRELEPAPDEPYMVDAKAFITQAETLLGYQIQIEIDKAGV
jgi:hypothetical protein